MKQNILYLGMHDDIVTVVTLFPHFDKLFVINKSDMHFKCKISPILNTIRYVS